MIHIWFITEMLCHMKLRICYTTWDFRYAVSHRAKWEKYISFITEKLCHMKLHLWYTTQNVRCAVIDRWAKYISKDMKGHYSDTEKVCDVLLMNNFTIYFLDRKYTVCHSMSLCWLNTINSWHTHIGGVSYYALMNFIF